MNAVVRYDKLSRTSLIIHTLIGIIRRVRVEVVPCKSHHVAWGCRAWNRDVRVRRGCQVERDKAVCVYPHLGLNYAEVREWKTNRNGSEDTVVRIRPLVVEDLCMRDRRESERIYPLVVRPRRCASGVVVCIKIAAAASGIQTYDRSVARWRGNGWCLRCSANCNGSTLGVNDVAAWR